MSGGNGVQQDCSAFFGNKHSPSVKVSLAAPIISLCISAPPYQPCPVPQVWVVQSNPCRRIILFNNETGFSTRDVQSLCDIHKSTKVHTAATTGHKGLGFKSVFKVSSRPQVHSGPFHFCFRSSEPLGYMYPFAVDDNESLAESPALFGLSEPYTTQIVLPLDPTVQMQLPPPETWAHGLLALRRVRRIAVMNYEVDAAPQEFARHDAVVPVVPEVTEVRVCQPPLQERRDRWLHVRCSYAPTVTKIVNRKEVKIESTTISVMVPLRDPTAPAAVYAVYATLPIQDYGLPVLVNADWTLDSARTTLQRSAWNEELRTRLEGMWVQVLDTLRRMADAGAHPNIAAGDRVAVARAFLETLPRAACAKDFFAATPAAVGIHLKDVQCVLTEGGCWARPRDVLLCSVEQVRALLSEEVLHAHCGRRFLHRRLTHPAIATLGVRALDFEHLVRILREGGADLLRQPPGGATGGVHSPAAAAALWCVVLYQFIRQAPAPDQPSMYAKLRDLRLLPLAGPSGDIAAADDKRGPLYLPEILARDVAAYEGPLQYIDLRFLEGGAPWVEADVAVANRHKLDDFLRHLGVRRATVAEVLRTAVRLAQVPAGEAAEGSVQRLVALAELLRVTVAHWSGDPQLRQVLIAELSVITSDGVRPLRDNALYLPRSYSDVSIAHYLPGAALLDGCYLRAARRTCEPGTGAAELQQQQCAFWRRLGVTDFLCNTDQQRFLADFEVARHALTGGCCARAEMPPQGWGQWCAVVRVLAERWSEYARLVVHIPAVAWLPTTLRGGLLAPPREVFTPRDVWWPYLQHHAAYPDPEVRLPGEVANTLQMHTRLGFDAVMEQLRQWAVLPDPKFACAHLETVYQYLNAENQREFGSQLERTRLVFIPLDGLPPCPDVEVPGAFLARECCIWEDRGNVLARIRNCPVKALRQFYPTCTFLRCGC